MAFHTQNPASSGDLVGEIGTLLAPDLKKVEQRLRKLVASDSKIIREVGEYVCLASSKKLRPMVTLLIARAFGDPGREAPVELATAMEAVHVATLLHDDVIDKAALRRGQMSVNARWGDDIAILMADYLYASAFDLALHHLHAEPLRLICNITRRMCEGEIYQIECREKWLSFDDYLHIITRKTAALFSACAAVGAWHSGLSNDVATQVGSFGHEFGLAFQITDDTLDYTADSALWGKPVGIDVTSGKQTLPLILALQSASPADRAAIERELAAGCDFGRMMEILERYNAIERALDIARTHARQACAHLEGLPVQDAAAFEFLQTLPDYVIARRY